MFHKYTHIFVNKSFSVHKLIDILFPGEEYFSLYQHSLVKEQFSIVLYLRIRLHEVSPFHINISFGVLVQVLLRQPCWWDLKGITSLTLLNIIWQQTSWFFLWFLKLSWPFFGDVPPSSRFRNWVVNHSVVPDHHTSFLLCILLGCGCQWYVMLCIYCKKKFLWGVRCIYSIFSCNLSSKAREFSY